MCRCITVFIVHCIEWLSKDRSVLHVSLFSEPAVLLRFRRLNPSASSTLTFRCALSKSSRHGRLAECATAPTWFDKQVSVRRWLENCALRANCAQRMESRLKTDTAGWSAILKRINETKEGIRNADLRVCFSLSMFFRPSEWLRPNLSKQNIWEMNCL